MLIGYIQKQHFDAINTQIAPMNAEIILSKLENISLELNPSIFISISEISNKA